MGIDMIAESPNIDLNDIESLEIMRSASSFMSKTLDGVLSIHKIEEGKFDLELGPTLLETLVRNAMLTFQGHHSSKRARRGYKLLSAYPKSRLGRRVSSRARRFQSAE